MGNTIAVEAAFLDGVSNPLKQLANKMGKTFGGIKTGFKDTQKSSQAMGKTVGKTLGSLINPLTLVAAGVGGVALALKSSIKAARGFQKEMALVATLVDTSTVNMEGLSDAVLDLSVKIGEPAEELSKGLFQVISAGVDASQAMNVLEVAAKGAAAGMTTTFTAVDGITSILNAYGLEASEATRISDLLFQTNKLGKTTFGQLAASIGTVISPAASLGINLNELFASVATLTKGGLNTARTMTALRATFLSILTPTADAQKVAKDLKIEWNALALRSKGLVGFLNEVKEKTKGNVVAMSKLVPEARALTGVMALVGKQSDELNRILGEFNKDTAGATEEAFKKVADTFDQQSKRFDTAINKIKISIGSKLLPFLADAATGIADFLTGAKEADNVKLNKVSEMFKNLSKEVEVSNKGLKATSDGMITLSNNMKDVVKTTEGSTKGFLTMGGSMSVVLDAGNEQNKTFKDMSVNLSLVNEETKKVKESQDLLNVSFDETKEKVPRIGKELTKQLDKFKKAAESIGQTQEDLIEKQFDLLDKQLETVKNSEKIRVQVREQADTLIEASLEKSLGKQEEAVRKSNENITNFIENADRQRLENQLKNLQNSKSKEFNVLAQSEDQKLQKIIEIQEELKLLDEAKIETELERRELELEELTIQEEEKNKIRLELRQAADEQIEALDEKRKLKQKEVDSFTIKSLKFTANVAQSSFSAVTRALVSGADATKAAYQAMSSTLATIAAEDLTKALKATIKGLVESIGGHIGLGVAATSSDASQKGGIVAALPTIGTYLASAGAGILAGKALAKGAVGRAQGGLAFPQNQTGLINRGTTGTADDVLVRSTPNMDVFGSRNEFIVNAHSTKKFLPMLEAINSGKIKTSQGFADGGLIKDQRIKTAAFIATGAAFSFAHAFFKVAAAGGFTPPAVAAGNTAGKIASKLHATKAVAGVIAAEGIASGVGKGLANGGIVTRPTIRPLGERGPEAVIPLNDPRTQDFLGGGPVVIENVIMFPNITSAQELFDTPPDVLKEWAKDTLFISFDELTREGVVPDFAR